MIVQMLLYESICTFRCIQNINPRYNAGSFEHALTSGFLGSTFLLFPN